jgi:hypothetical protein
MSGMSMLSSGPCRPHQPVDMEASHQEIHPKLSIAMLLLFLILFSLHSTLTIFGKLLAN